MTADGSPDAVGLAGPAARRGPRRPQRSARAGARPEAPDVVYFSGSLRGLPRCRVLELELNSARPTGSGTPPLSARADFDAKTSARAVKNLSLAEDLFRDHLPGFPIMPASLMLEGLAQTGGILVGDELAPTVLEYVRARTAVVQAGATIVPMAGDTYTWPKVPAPATPEWKAELAPMTATLIAGSCRWASLEQRPRS